MGRARRGKWERRQGRKWEDRKLPAWLAAFADVPHMPKSAFCEHGFVIAGRYCPICAIKPFTVERAA